MNTKIVPPLLLLAVSAGIAAPMKDEPFSFVQPDGSKVPVLVTGDEYYSRVSSLDGCTLMRDSDGWIKYAQLSKDSCSFVGTAVYRGTNSRAGSGWVKGVDLCKKARAAEAAKMIQRIGGPGKSSVSSERAGTKGYQRDPRIGTYKGLTLFVDFSDEPAAIPADKFDSYLNGDNYREFGNVSSVKGWYQNVSQGLLTYTNRSWGYYRAKHPKSYYEDTAVTFGTRTAELINEVLKAANGAGVDFSDLSVIGGSVPLNIFYAGGPSYGWGQGLWPHNASLQAVQNYQGKTFRNYQISGIGSELKLGTFVHENGHMLLDYPDLYPYDTSASDEWIRSYCAMGHGSYNGDQKNPVPFNPYFRWISGWISPVDLYGKTNAAVSMIPSSLGTVRMVTKNGSDAELFFIDARSRIGASDSFPGEGLLIWKADSRGNNTSGSRPLLKIVQADEAADSLCFKAGDFFVNMPGEAFSGTTRPSSKWSDGTASGLDIRNISRFQNPITFDLGAGGDFLPTFKMTAPADGITCSRGSAIPVKWETDQPGTAVLNLLKNGKPVRTIGTCEASARSFEWIPEPADIGAGFSIQLTIGTLTDSSGLFAVLPKKLPRSSLAAAGCDSWETGQMDGKPENILDGSTETFWNSKYDSGIGDMAFPHDVVVQITGTAPENILGIGYTPRCDGWDFGDVKEFSVYTSADGNDFVKVHSGVMVHRGSGEVPVIFDSPIPGNRVKCIKFEALSDILGQTETSMAEFSLYIDTVSESSPVVRSTVNRHSAALLSMSNSSLEIRVPSAGLYEISVYSISGRRITVRRGHFEAGAVLLENLSLSAGVYAVSIAGSGLEGTFKGIVR